MKKLSLLSLLLAAAAFAQSDTVVRWRAIAGVITAPGVDNPVGTIHSGAGPWTTRSGNARLNLQTGEGSFEVEGLVLNGGSSTGTAGPVAAVMGTVVCNPGSPSGTVESTLDTPTTKLSTDGHASLSFKVNVPASCNNPLFLVRVPSGRWIATGVRTITEANSHY
jgi:hypothetical protein